MCSVRLNSALKYSEAFQLLTATKGVLDKLQYSGLSLLNGVLIGM